MIAIVPPFPLLPAPQIAGLLPEKAASLQAADPGPEPLCKCNTETEPQIRRVAPLYALTADEESLLLTALLHYERQAACRKSGLDDAARWMIVPPHSRGVADNLVMYGYLHKRPGKRFKRWYGITEDGIVRARAVRQGREEEFDAEFLTPSALMTDQQRLEYARRVRLERLIEELAHQGFVIYAEAGRGPALGEQAFYNVFSGEIRLYRCPLGTAVWQLRSDGYYRPDGTSTADLAAHLAAVINF